MAPKRRRVVRFLQEFSVPLIAGVFAALAFANIDFEAYSKLLHIKPIPGLTEIFGHKADFHFLINDVFMVFFFGLSLIHI